MSFLCFTTYDLYLYCVHYSLLRHFGNNIDKEKFTMSVIKYTDSYDSGSASIQGRYTSPVELSSSGKRDFHQVDTEAKDPINVSKRNKKSNSTSRKKTTDNLSVNEVSETSSSNEVTVYSISITQSFINACHC